FRRVVEQVACCFTIVDVQSRNAVGVVVVEHQTAALLIGPIEGHGPIPGIAGSACRQLSDSATRAIRRYRGAALAYNDSGDEVHVGDILRAPALFETGDFVCGYSPLMRRAVTDPWCISPVEVERGPIL